jgi:hypothetical protein
MKENVEMLFVAFYLFWQSELVDGFLYKVLFLVKSQDLWLFMILTIWHVVLIMLTILICIIHGLRLQVRLIL